MAVPVSVRKVESRRDFNTFLKFPWTLYKDDPCWVPLLVSMQKHKLDKTKNPAWKYMHGDYFIAWRGGQPVGTIAAFINHRHNEFQNEHIGFFGLFEVINDQEAANALLDTAAEYVRALGYDAIRGPASFSTNDECGILIEGFEDRPAILMPYNPPYYRTLLDGAPGFEKVMDTYSYLFSLEGWTASEKMQQTLRVTRKNNERRGITVRPLDKKRLKDELQILKKIYNQAWEKNWGFVPLTDEELDAMIKDLGQFVEPRLVVFGEVKEEPAAFLLAMPDMNQPLYHAYPRPGKPEILTLLQTLWHWKVRCKINRIRLALMGVQERYRGTGVEAAMFMELFERAVEMSAETGWQHADAGWVLETNEPMQRIVEAYSGKRYKRYRFYERALSGSPGAV